MFVILINYKVALEEVDVHLDAHRDFLNEQISKGKYLAAARRIPRDGGLIIAKCENREEASLIASQDPFVSSGVADFTLIEFNPTLYSEDFAKLL